MGRDGLEETAIGLAEHGSFGVALGPGDVIELAGLRDGGEPLRTDWIEIELGRRSA